MSGEARKETATELVSAAVLQRLKRMLDLVLKA